MSACRETTTNPQDAIDQEADDTYWSCRAYLRGPHAARSLWKQLNSSERMSLGGELNIALERYGYPMEIWMHLHHVSETRAILDLGEELGFMSAKDADWIRRELGELPRDPEMAQSEAINRGDLVIERSSRSVYWKGELIEADWFRHNKSWEFLLTVCEHAQRNEPIDRLAFGEDADFDIVSKNKSRLKKQVPEFPNELYSAFRKEGTGTQRFEIDREKIHIFD
tara:strand:+ start:346 stop:1017 length:672 start_codon:yes stop_codon:yes gene_type:complete